MVQACLKKMQMGVIVDVNSSKFEIVSKLEGGMMLWLQALF
jgi:hypothetical protein